MQLQRSVGTRMRCSCSFLPESVDSIEKRSETGNANVASTKTLFMHLILSKVKLRNPVKILRMDGWMDGWMICDFRPFQQYFNHIKTMGG